MGFILAALTLIPPLSTPEQGPPPALEVEGIYRSKVIHEGEDFLGICTVRKLQSVDAYSFLWSFDNGDRAIGQGIRDGNRIWVAWGRTSVQICRFKIEVGKDGNPKLVGELLTDEKMEFIRGLQWKE